MWYRWIATCNSFQTNINTLPKIHFKSTFTTDKKPYPPNFKEISTKCHFSISTHLKCCTISQYIYAFWLELSIRSKINTYF